MTRVAIVGAGLAGLASAEALLVAGCDVVVLEARDPALTALRDRLVLAGEHTAGPYSALMEGALRSGARAADQLIARFSLRRP